MKVIDTQSWYNTIIIFPPQNSPAPARHIYFALHATRWILTPGSASLGWNPERM